MSATPLKLGIAGLGTVGTAVVQLLHRNAEALTARGGRALEPVAVSARDRNRERGVDLGGVRWYDDATALAADPEVQAVVELIGGEDGVALALTKAALAAGKPVVTANKAMLAHHGAELAQIAEEHGAGLAFEAAIAGGIPIVKAIREGLAGNRVGRVYGILNGTCNFVLSAMAASGRDFADVLKEAQALGYAEADPSFDVDGIDAAHKLALLAALAFGCPPDFAGVHVEGIRQVGALDIAFAHETGYRVKLLGVARLTEHGLEQRVHPCLVPATAPISSVDGVINAVAVEGDAVGATLQVGPGAGGGPTASAVVADLVDLARGALVPAFALPAARLTRLQRAPMDRHVGAYYIRLTVADRPGVLAEVAAVLRDHEISVETLIQRGRHSFEPVPIMLVTHEASEAAMVRALTRIAALDAVVEAPRSIRIEPL